MTYESIEINRLDRSPRNVRKTRSTNALEELKASLLAHGLMQNLVVVPAKKGKYHVIAGGRRLEALRALQAEGKLTADFAVLCQIAEGDQAVEMSLAENTVRQAMHPADEFEAYADLIEQGKDSAQVAERFGVTERHVLQRMKLGRVAPKLLEAYRAEELTLDALMAFAVSDDHKRQVSVWKSLEGWQQDNARHIRSKLTEAMTESDDGLVAFVGLDAYRAAGGTVKADLFSDAAYLEDAGLLERLSREKLEAEAEELRAEGWGWVEIETDDSTPTYRCQRIHPKPVDAPPELLAELERANAELAELEGRIDSEEDEDDLSDLLAQQDGYESRITEINEQLAAISAFDPEEMKTAGCYLSVTYDGDLDIERGLVKPGDSSEQSQDEEVNAGSPTKEKPEFSQSLLADLKAFRAQAAQVEIARNPQIAFDLLVFHTVSDLLSPGGFSRRGLDVHFRQTFPRPSVEPKNAATEALAVVKQSLPVAWLNEDDEAARFIAFRSLAEDDKHRLLAFCAALTLKPDFGVVGVGPMAYDVSLEATQGTVAAFWRPSKDNYLSRISKDQLLAVGQGIFAGKWADHRKGWKKADIVSRLDADFRDPDGAIEHYRKVAQAIASDAVDKLRTWMPKGMEFQADEIIKVPISRPAKRGRKAA